MARILNGFLGNASGKLGNVVFSKWRDLQTARQYQPDIQDAQSPSQLVQRSRMVSLLQFLKPINASFIRFFNSKICPRSTPWAQAIKDNMQAVSSDGCIIPDSFSLGTPKYPAPDTFNVIYDPFIDQTSFEYISSFLPPADVPCSFPLSSVLGKYLSDSAVHVFDTRQLALNQPSGSFFGFVNDVQDEWIFQNCWNGHWFWLSFYEFNQDMFAVNPNSFLALPAFQQATSILKGFNMDFSENLLPVEAISSQWRIDAGKCYLDFSLDVTKCNYNAIKNFTAIFWLLGLKNSLADISVPFEWDLISTTFSIDMGVADFPGSVICLYAVFNPGGQQVSRFNRFYHAQGTDLKYYPLFDQLFQCDYTHPSSFLLSGNQCGFVANIDELFSDFIELWEQCIIYDHSLPEPPTPGSQIIDYGKFKCEVYSPDGEIILNVPVNSAHDYFAQGLVPSQDYYIVFSYDDMLIECFHFNCCQVSKVIYFSRGLIISQKSCDDPPKNFMIEVKSKTKRAELYHVPHMSWARDAIEYYLKSSGSANPRYICPKELICFGIGADITGGFG